jgi:hypothetical protein
MPHSPLPIFAIEGSALYQTGRRTIVCLSCGDTMEHLRTIAKNGVTAARLIFVCPSCKGVDTKELKWAA